MEQKILKEGPLLDNNGNLLEAGYSFSLVKEYKREQIKKIKGLRIKEWDYYFFHDSNYGIALTVADNSYMGMLSLSLIDFKNKKEITKSSMEFFTLGDYDLPSTSKEGHIYVETKKAKFSFETDEKERRLVVKFKNFYNGKDFRGEFVLKQTTNKSMVIATPFKQNKCFYYNQKINLLKAEGHYSIGEEVYTLEPNSFGVLDWGRGVWNYKNTWYWSSLNAFDKGHKIGFNLGYGFGDTSNASENMFFYDDKAYKLNDVKFIIPEVNKEKLYLNPWNIASENKDIDLVFVPILDRHSNDNVLIIQSNQHQVFGRFAGFITIDDKKYHIDNLLGFAEIVKNRW